MTTTSSRPAVVLVPGMATAGTVAYEPLMAELRSLGWNDEDLTAVDNPSVDSVANKSDVKPNALVADIRNLRSILSRLIEEQGRNVLVVAHSYGGTPALSACQDLWQHVRQQQAKSGGVIRVGLIASSLTLPGSSVAVDRSSWQEANGIPPDTAPEGVEIVDGEPILTPTGFEHVWMNDIVDPKPVSCLRPAALSCAFTTVAADIDPKQWRITYLILTELDLAMSEALQQHLIDRAKEAGAEVKSNKLKSGHFAQISHAKEVADWVAGLV